MNNNSAASSSRTCSLRSSTVAARTPRANNPSGSGVGRQSPAMRRQRASPLTNNAGINKTRAKKPKKPRRPETSKNIVPTFPSVVYNPETAPAGVTPQLFKSRNPYRQWEQTYGLLVPHPVDEREHPIYPGDPLGPPLRYCSRERSWKPRGEFALDPEDPTKLAVNNTGYAGTSCTRCIVRKALARQSRLEEEEEEEEEEEVPVVVPPKKKRAKRAKNSELQRMEKELAMAEKQVQRDEKEDRLYQQTLIPKQRRREERDRLRLEVARKKAEDGDFAEDDLADDDDMTFGNRGLSPIEENDELTPIPESEDREQGNYDSQSPGRASEDQFDDMFDVDGDANMDDFFANTNYSDFAYPGSPVVPTRPVARTTHPTGTTRRNYAANAANAINTNNILRAPSASTLRIPAPAPVPTPAPGTSDRAARARALHSQRYYSDSATIPPPPPPSPTTVPTCTRTLAQSQAQAEARVRAQVSSHSNRPAQSSQYQSTSYQPASYQSAQNQAPHYESSRYDSQPSPGHFEEAFASLRTRVDDNDYSYDDAVEEDPENSDDPEYLRRMQKY
ncbi:hypothetical protein SBOR_9271 [Sclerotinia borealis F-4128]|uniref:Uncharacterized protein n=1 Tax=Sclerotinia borealis (strain F-4128) TaxID=1432307 RepID=W9C631_SCLBF|nr:hypothetical protein SBOR_9271 [Sclerotinia borealis F-4128]